MPYKTVIRLIGVARNSANGFPARLLDPDGKVSIAGTRVQKMILDDGTEIVEAGKVVPGPALTVTVIDFLARGGDEYPFEA